MNPHNKESKSGNLGGHGIVPTLTIYLPTRVLFDHSGSKQQTRKQAVRYNNSGVLLPILQQTLRF
jgi:hypothetical protein